MRDLSFLKDPSDESVLVYETSYQELGYQRRATVPVEVARHLGLKHKDRIEWRLVKDGVLLKKAEP